MLFKILITHLAMDRFAITMRSNRDAFQLLKRDIQMT